MRRIDWAYGVCRPGRRAARPAELADASLGPLLRADTLQAMRARRLAPRRDDAAADLPRIPEAMTMKL